MHRLTFAGALVIGAALMSAACNREQEMTPGTEVQTQSARPAQTPMTVTGCLRAGEAADTFVVTTTRAEGAAEPATYQLVGDQASNLTDHIGRRVEVQGTMEAQQEVATRSTARTEKERPEGTSGTVQTRSEIDIKRLAVNSVRPLGDDCDE